MSALPPDAWVPVPLRWRYVRVGDVFFSEKTGDLWTVVEDLDPHWKIDGKITVQRGTRTFSSKVDPDDLIQVLVPVAERDAMALAREELGARLADRRTAPPEVAA
jgi:hypothetical protein